MYFLPTNKVGGSFLAPINLAATTAQPSPRFLQVAEVVYI